jgi:hypothetical protein
MESKITKNFKDAITNAFAQNAALNPDLNKIDGVLEKQGYINSLKEFDDEESTSQETNEKWSEKYKKSIDCNNPKGFSQRAHCQGRKKKLKENLTEAERTAMAKLRDLAKKHACKGSKDCTAKDKIDSMYQELKKQYSMGIKVEKEHKTEDPKQIAIDHLSEDPEYYTKLKKIETKEVTGSGSSGSFAGPMSFSNTEFVKKSLKEKPKKVETKEATGSGSSGSYESPAFGAKSMSPKDWRGASKTQIPGGKFVKIKKKCKKFPYCNQGDIKALTLFENKFVKRIINNLSKEYGVSDESILKMIMNEIYTKK